MGAVESLIGGQQAYMVGQHRVTKIKQLAEGGFSYVDLVRDDAQPQKHYALKRILCQTKEQVTAAKAEIALHTAISHPFVLALIDSAILPAKDVPNAQEALLLFPVYKHGSIVDAVQRYNDAHPTSSSSSTHNSKERSPALWPFPEHEALRIFYACAQGVSAIHGTGLAHRDLKPHNVLLSYPDGALDDPSVTGMEPTPILIDLGSADTLIQTPADRKAAFSLQEKAEVDCTASYRAPELYDVKVGATIDDKADLFSLALVLYFLAFGKSAFETEEEGVLTLAIKAGNVRFPEDYLREHAGSASSSVGSVHPSRLFSLDFVEFIKEMLVADPAARLNLRDAMKKSVILMLAATERAQTAAAAASIASSSDGDEDGFGAFESASSPAPSTAALDLFVTDMQLGSSSSSPQFAPGGFLKFGRKGSPHPTRLQLVPTKDAITWTSKGGAVRTIPLARITSVVTGQTTAKFARAKEDRAYASKAHLSFSLILKPSTSSTPPSADEPAAGEETLDLQAENHYLFRTWAVGLAHIVANPQAAGQALGI